MLFITLANLRALIDNDPERVNAQPQRCGCRAPSRNASRPANIVFHPCLNAP